MMAGSVEPGLIGEEGAGASLVGDWGGGGLFGEPSRGASFGMACRMGDARAGFGGEGVVMNSVTMSDIFVWISERGISVDPSTNPPRA